MSKKTINVIPDTNIVITIPVLETQIIEAAIDYKQGCDNSGFADEFGGLCHLKDNLFLLIDRYQSFDNQYVGRKD